MKPTRATPAVLCLCVAATACRGATSGHADPQEPAAAPGNRASAVVICPDGSTYDPSRNVCLATSGLPPSEKDESSRAERGNARVTVRCNFRNGWVSVLPASEYPSNDTFLMQALIGMNEEPDFWAEEKEYAHLEPYAARKCAKKDEVFRVQPGSYFVLVGETNTFSRRGKYQKNGLRRRIRVSSERSVNVAVSTSDLTHTWDCISCPFVAFWDPTRNRYRPAFVVLAHRSSRSRKGTDRIPVTQVPVKNGKIKLRVVEAEREVSHLDQLVLESNGAKYLPVRGGARSALADADGLEVEMHRGRQITVEYAVPGVWEGEVNVDVVAHGYYEPQ